MGEYEVFTFEEDVNENVVNSAKIFLYYESNSYFIEDEYECGIGHHCR